MSRWKITGDPITVTVEGDKLVFNQTAAAEGALSS
jgi:hypothetical protein